MQNDPLHINDRFVTRARRFSRAAGLFVALIGALSLAGWIFDVHGLKSVYAGITIKANTALGLLLAGISLRLLDISETRAALRFIGQGCAVAITLIGLLTLSQHIIGWDLGIDQLLFIEPPGAPATASPNRMGPPASTCFTLSGLALLLFYSRRHSILPQFLSLIVSLWGLLAIIGYAYQTKALYYIGDITGIALHTAVAFFILALGLLAVYPDRGLTSAVSSRQAGGVMARRLLIAAVIVPLLLGWLSLRAFRAEYFDAGYSSALLVLSIIIVFTVIIWWSATQLNRADVAVRESEAKFSLIYDKAPFAIAITRLSDDIIVDVNEAFTALLGYSRQETIGRTGRELNMIVAAGEREHAYAELQQRDAIYDREMPVRTKSGKIRILSQNANVIMLNGENHILATLYDITERKEVEENLRQQQQTHQILLQAVSDLGNAVAIANDRAQIVFVNEAMCRLYGYTREELLNLPSTWDLIPPEDRPALQEQYRRRIQGEPVPDFIEITILRRDGSPVRIELAIKTLPQGEELRFIVIARDITERKQTDEALRGSEERFRAAVESAPNAILIVDGNGTITLVNSQAERLFDFSRAELLGAQVDMLVPERFRALHGMHRSGFMSNPQTRTMGAGRDLFCLRKDETEVPVEIGLNPLTTSKGEFVLISVIDITERKQAEREREELLVRERSMRAESEQASRLKDEFLATISHELRTPLTAILGWTAMLREGELDVATSERALESIERNGMAQAQLIEDLLDVSRITSGKLHLDIRSVDLASVIHAATDSVRPAADARGIQLRLVIDPNARHVQGDAARIQQIIWNLLSNAVKFTPREGEVEMKLARTETQAEISVSDTGEGISPEFLPYVFDRFRQADGSKTRKHGGLGLGLAIARHFVEMHGGTIEVFSEGLGRGATFTVRIPLAAVRTAEPLPTAHHEETPAQQTKSGTGRTDLHGLRILAVDDEADMREMLQVLLRGYGADVMTAASASEALTTFTAWKPDLLLCDIGMPGEDGYSLIRRIRETEALNGRITPAIALTGYVRVEERMQALMAGFQMFVPKPVETEELAAVIAGLVGRGEL